MIEQRYHIAPRFRAVLLTHLHVVLFSDKGGAETKRTSYEFDQDGERKHELRRASISISSVADGVVKTELTGSAQIGKVSGLDLASREFQMAPVAPRPQPQGDWSDFNPLGNQLGRQSC